MFNEKIDRFVNLAIKCNPGLKNRYNRFLLEIPGNLKKKIAEMENFEREIVVSPIDGSYLVMQFNVVSISEDNELAEFYIKIDKVTTEADILETKTLYIQLPSEVFINKDFDEDIFLPEMLVLSENDPINKKQQKYSYNIVKAGFEYEMECFRYVYNKGLSMKEKEVLELSEEDLFSTMCEDLKMNT